MPRTFTSLLAALAVAGAAAAPSTLAAQRDYAQRVDTTFAFGKGGWLDVGIVSGTIVITGWTRPEARVVARIERGGFETTFSSSRIGLDVRGETRGRSRVGEARVEISVPIGTRVMASAVSGDIRVRGTTAEVQARTVSGALEVVDAGDRVEASTVSGDLRVEKIRGNLRVGTTSGDLELDDLVGDLEVRSVSSTMQLRRVESSHVRVSTTSGDITYQGSVDPKGTYDLNTHSGDVRFAIPASSGATLALQTFSGEIESDFPMTLQPGENIRRSRGRRMEFGIGQGGARITITTFSGDITIERGSVRANKEN